LSQRKDVHDFPAWFLAAWQAACPFLRHCSKRLAMKINH